jgi:uncharacterized protein with PIN domain
MNEKYKEKKVVPSTTKDPYVIDFTVDLTKIGGDGGFPCPKCGKPISPDDESEDNYEIIETKVKDDELSELVVQCNKCGKYTRVAGFLSSPERKEESETV